MSELTKSAKEIQAKVIIKPPTCNNNNNIINNPNNNINNIINNNNNNPNNNNNNNIDYKSPQVLKEVYNGVPRAQIEEQWVNIEIAARRLSPYLFKTLLRHGNPISHHAPEFNDINNNIHHIHNVNSRSLDDDDNNNNNNNNNNNSDNIDNKSKNGNLNNNNKSKNNKNNNNNNIPQALYYKCDHLRFTGSFKERGALNSLLSLSPEERSKGVVAASAGNHALALAYHGRILNIPIIVIMPINAPITKIENCKILGANVILFGVNFAEAMVKARSICSEKGMKYINGYDHPDVISGAGTCGLEILEQLPNVDAIIIPCGGGGLLAGVSLAVKRINPKVKIIGVESDRCPSMCMALKNGKPIPTEVNGGTIADGLAVTTVGINAYNIIERYVDEIIAIPEHYISIAILHLLEKEKILCEGAGCAGLAGIFSGKLNKSLSDCKKVVTILCGGNIDMTMLGRVIERGLYSTGRLMQFDCAISDRVGGLSRFCQCLADTKASVKEIVQDRPFITDLNVCSVHLTIEVLSYNHWLDIVSDMGKQGFDLKPVNDNKFDGVNLVGLYSGGGLAPDRRAKL